MNLQIQCPKCAKRFTIHEDLTGKTVECGACDHRFPVKTENIITGRSKVYPGEQRRDEFLNRLGRNPVAAPSKKQASRISAQPEQQFSTPHVDAIMPASAGQNIAATAGAALLVLFALVFFLGTTEGGNFKDFDMFKRLVLGGFISFLGGGLILLGAKNWRAKGVVLVVVVVTALFALILIRPVEMTPEGVELAGDDASPTNPVLIEGSASDEAAIKDQVGYHAMDRKLQKMSERFDGDPSNYLVGIFIKDLKSTQFHIVENYLKTALEIPPTEGINRYSRNGDKDSLIVVSGLKLDFDSVVRACDPRLGRATTYPELRLIELRLSALLNTKPSEDLQQKLSNPNDPGFFSGNLNELGVLDPLRVRNAVAQLAKVHPSVELRNRDEIVEALMGLVSRQTDPILLNHLGNALGIWAVDNQASIDIVARRVQSWVEAEKEVPVSFIEYLIKSNSNQSPLLVDQLWSKDPEKWASQYVALGNGAEKRVLWHLEGPSLRLRNAAAFILASIGTERSLPALTKFTDSDDPELKILVDRAIQAIKSR